MKSFSAVNKRDDKKNSTNWLLSQNCHYRSVIIAWLNALDSAQHFNLLDAIQDFATAD
jgi:hypothetical protein